MQNSSPVFYSIAAQHDNLGDIEIRRVVLGWLRQLDRPIVTYVGGMPDEYINAFGEVPGVEMHRSRLAFELRLLAGALKGGAALVLPPGPQIFGPMALAAHSTVNLLNAALLRVRGGRSAVIGRSLRGTASLGKRIDRALIQTQEIFFVRDDVSASEIGLELPRCPDVALAEQDTAPTTGTRRAVSMSFRGDRTIDPELLVDFVRSARAAGYEPVLVSQVRRDDAQHRDLARALGVETELWGDRSHVEQEAAVRHRYRQSAFMLSNRLHGLVMAMQCGAVPISPSFDASDKVSSTLDGVISVHRWTGASSEDQTPGEPMWTGHDLHARTLEKELAGARADLDEASRLFRAALTH